MTGNPDNIILVTRPKAQADAYALELRARFASRALVLVSPLQTIVPIAAQVDLGGVAAVLFTSSNAVRRFAGLSARRDIACFCVGDKTAAVARQEGFCALSAAGNLADLEALIATRLKPDAGVCLHVRGRHVSGHIAADLAERGYKTREAVVYDQKGEALNARALAALAGSNAVIAPLFSPRTAVSFSEATKKVSTEFVTAICISNTVAENLDVARFHEVRIAKEPNAASVTREIDAIL